MRNHEIAMKTWIGYIPEFEKKILVSFAINDGLKCGHDCLYCSTGAMLRNHKAFKILQESPFDHGYSIVDPSSPERIVPDAARMTTSGMVQICTITDAWVPGAQKHDLGRRCLQAILDQSDWSIRILTKNAAVVDDFNLIEQQWNCVMVGLSITATPERKDVINILEPNASSIEERMLAMVQAAARRFQTYAMFCPLQLEIVDGYKQINRLIRFAVDCMVEEIFVEPVHPRGPGLKNGQVALEQWSYEKQARAIGAIRKQDLWSRYVVEPLRTIQCCVRQFPNIKKLRFLLYPSRLLLKHVAIIRQSDEGVIWLGKL